MKRIGYLIRRIWEMDHRAMLRAVGRIHRKTGRSRLWLFCDMVRCGTRYGAGYKDYEQCEFYDLTPEQRATYVTRGINNRIVQRLNDPAYEHFMEDKAEFNEKFAPFIRRGWLDLRTADGAAFADFMRDRETIVAKPLSAACGQGVEKLNKSDFPSAEAMFDKLRADGIGLIEDCVVQHEALSRLYPYAVNTYRIMTVLSGGEAHVVYAYIRLGNGGKCVDNLHAGGMMAPVDEKTGAICYPAYDTEYHAYTEHPMTGCPLIGYVLPFWRESVEMCCEAAKVLPQIGYVGWDVAVDAEGPQLIEGNQFPGFDLLQIPAYMPGKCGMLPRFQALLPEL